MSDHFKLQISKFDSQGYSSSKTSAPLSPLKKHKHGGAVETDLSGPARAVARLAGRLLPDLLSDYEPVWLELLIEPLQPLLAEPGGAESGAELPVGLTAEELAGRELWPSAGQQKRQGAFYTGPDLARYIVAQTFGEVQTPQTVLDLACGGGIFLLAALEELQRREPRQNWSELVAGRLYGLDLNPGAVVLSRLTLLKRVMELSGERVSPALLVAIMTQVRQGNALVGTVDQTEPDLSRERTALFEKVRAGDAQSALAIYRKLETALPAARQAVNQAVAALPIFNEPEDGPRLATQHPFGWGLEFPEVMAAGGFGAVVGNPPYLGFNDYSGIEKAYFAHTFTPVYNLKSDLFYYFIKRGVELLEPGGRLGYVVSRFWKEAAFAAPLRRWVAAETRLRAIEDLGREQVFETAQVDVCLLFASRENVADDYQFPFSYAGQTRLIEQKRLGGGNSWAWLRRPPAETALLEKLQTLTEPLGSLAECRTGVQTGLDVAFWLDKEQAGRLDIEPGVLRRALKNRDIKPGGLEWSGLWLLYPPAGLDPADYPRLLTYLGQWQARLERRLRYDTPFPFYELQWPREAHLFTAPAKLVTPYKAPRNTFAVDREGFFFSTDVISLVFPPDWAYLELAANFLNSRLSTFQFRQYGKPVGGGQWDYYANPVKKLAFPNPAMLAARPDIVARLNQPGLNQPDIDALVFDWFDLNGNEREMIWQM